MIIRQRWSNASNGVRGRCIPPFQCCYKNCWTVIFTIFTSHFKFNLILICRPSFPRFYHASCSQICVFFSSNFQFFRSCSFLVLNFSFFNYAVFKSNCELALKTDLPIIEKTVPMNGYLKISCGFSFISFFFSHFFRKRYGALIEKKNHVNYSNWCAFWYFYLRFINISHFFFTPLSLIHIWRCRRSTLCRSRWSPYH